MRLIDADALRASAMQATETNEVSFNNCFPYWQFSKCIKETPTIDAVPVVRGEWIAKPHTISLDNVTLTGTYPTCNLCGYAWLGVAKNTNYCPNCGAKMEDKP